MEKHKNKVLLIKEIFCKIREYIFSKVFCYTDFYQIFPKKIKKAKEWLNNKLQKITKQEDIEIEYKNVIRNISDQEIVAGRYIIYGSYKKIELLKSYSHFQKELIWLHELGHHFFKKVGFGGKLSSESEEMVNKIVLSIIKTFPKWIIQTMKTSITCGFNIKDEDFKKIFGITYYDIVKSERK
jgi:hypothetical protein